MTQENTNKYWKELEALKAGKVIQRRFKKNGNENWSEWEDIEDPTFTINLAIEFRIKPEPREWWMVAENVEGDDYWCERFTSEQDAKARLEKLNPELVEIVHVREIK